tara:strand:- start:25 stop:264 length:240 start_codon:yes stop_codon:yes gene_type:complete
MTMYNYFQTDSNGLIFHIFESDKQASSEQTELIPVDTYDPSYCGRYYLNGEIGPAPRDGYYWVWNADTNQFVETLITTE